MLLSLMYIHIRLNCRNYCSVHEEFRLYYIMFLLTDSALYHSLKTIGSKGHATRYDIVDDIVDFSSSTMAFNVAKIASSARSLTVSLTNSLRVAWP